MERFYTSRHGRDLVRGPTVAALVLHHLDSLPLRYATRQPLDLGGLLMSFIHRMCASTPLEPSPLVDRALTTRSCKAMHYFMQTIRRVLEAFSQMWDPPGVVLQDLLATALPFGEQQQQPPQLGDGGMLVGGGIGGGELPWDVDGGMDGDMDMGLDAGLGGGMDGGMEGGMGGGGGGGDSERRNRWLDSRKQRHLVH